jgi:hypothetical protein
MWFFVMGDHEVKVSGFVHLVATFLLESGACAPFMGDKPLVLSVRGEVRKTGLFEGQAMCIRTAGDRSGPQKPQTRALTGIPAIIDDQQKRCRVRRPGSGRWSAGSACLCALPVRF